MNRDEVGAIRACVFCGGKPLTTEHVWPDWIGRLFFGYSKDGRAPLAPHRASTSLPRESDREWTAPSFDTKVRVVCTECNNGWMSDLEVAAKPILVRMLTGKRVVLDDASQAVVSQWVVKTAMMFQHTTPRRPIPDHHFRYLYDHRRPPPSSQVWIAARTAEDGGIVSGLQSARLKLKPDGPNTEANSAYLVTIGIAAFVGQLFGHDLPRLDFRRSHKGIFTSAVEQIWPTVETVVEWPPKHIIRSVEDFANDSDFGAHLVRSLAAQGLDLRIIPR